jgi:hypothetical protein
MADIFDRFFQTLPKEKQFSLTELDAPREADFQSFVKQHGLRDSNDYDLRGAFLAGDVPDETGHMGSIGLEGRMLKHPSYETAWKTAFVEIMRSLGKEKEFHPDMFPDRQAAAQFMDSLMLGEPAL